MSGQKQQEKQQQPTNPPTSGNLEPVYLASPAQQQSTPSDLTSPVPEPISSSSTQAPLLDSDSDGNDSSDSRPSPWSNNSDRLKRIRKGTKFENAYPSIFSQLAVEEEPDPTTLLATLESPFQVQEYIAQLVRADPHSVGRIIRLPMRDENNPLVQRHVWIYEQLRRLAHDLGHPLVTALQAECGRNECPEMKAGEWLYLCAAHASANENECCAIDYIVHTLDGATALLNSARYFPSRLQIPGSSIKHFTSIARRLYRILAHAWFHHRELFEQCETETSLYARFLGLTDEFGLIAEDLLVIPRDRKKENDDFMEIEADRDRGGEIERRREGLEDRKVLNNGSLEQRVKVPLPDEGDDDELEELE
ncbi:Mob1/phocein [Phakopsora pachyrhizi]|uniref:Mob1/phocein n=1 Tax=Phakopsora pachyrhizi TaxID=170000 RepID=A0AAV0BVQ7_PHAPC|nr:Mob1/phocein [Phakopsora pachyrhizi]CAH7690302.1 Mob1/phocein [Phakopsora pachyrhizi]